MNIKVFNSSLVTMVMLFLFASSCKKQDDITLAKDPFKVLALTPLTDKIPFQALVSGKILSIEKASMKYFIKTIVFITVYSISIIMIHSCKKNDNVDFTLRTAPISGITQTTAITGGIFGTHELLIESTGVCYNTIGSPSLEYTTGAVLNRKDSITTDDSGAINFVSTLRGLKPSTTYYVVAYAKWDAGVLYGKVLSFKTLAAEE